MVIMLAFRTMSIIDMDNLGLKNYRMAYMVFKTPRLNFNHFNYRHRLAR